MSVEIMSLKQNSKVTTVFVFRSAYCSVTWLDVLHADLILTALLPLQYESRLSMFSGLGGITHTGL